VVEFLQQLFEFLNQSDKYYYPINIDYHQRNGGVLARNDIKNLDELSTNVMNFLEYNDDWLYRNPFQFKSKFLQ
jgi:hypothetical protein